MKTHATEKGKRTLFPIYGEALKVPANQSLPRWGKCLEGS